MRRDTASRRITFVTSRDKHKPLRFWTMRAKVMSTCEILFRSEKLLLINGLHVRVLPGSPFKLSDLQENVREAEKASVVAMVVGARRFFDIGRSQPTANRSPLGRIHLDRSDSSFRFVPLLRLWSFIEGPQEAPRQEHPLPLAQTLCRASALTEKKLKLAIPVTTSPIKWRPSKNN